MANLPVYLAFANLRASSFAKRGTFSNTDLAKANLITGIRVYDTAKESCQYDLFSSSPIQYKDPFQSESVAPRMATRTMTSCMTYDCLMNIG